MKYRLNSILRCPECNSFFALHVFEEEERFPGNNYRLDSSICSRRCSFREQKACRKCASLEIVTGLLACECGNLYPIVNYVPRVYPSAFNEFPDYAVRYKNIIKEKLNASVQGKKLTELEKLCESTKIAFQMQWQEWGSEEKIFGKNYEETKEYLVKHLTPSYAGEQYYSPDKLILDAGCGHGRYIEVISKDYGSEAVGLELSRAADVAWDHNKENIAAHIVQGNILFSPFDHKTFDFVFSSGVIHHTPDTRWAFHQLAELVKTGGFYSIWVYPKWSWLWETTQGLIRGITTKLPPRLLYFLCYIPVPLLSIFPTYSHTKLGKANWRQCAQVVWDFYSPRYQTHHTIEEVNQWFREEGFSDIKNNEPPVNAFGKKIRR